MKTSLISLILFIIAFTGCSDEYMREHYLGNAEYEIRPIINNIQKCYFPETLTIVKDGDTTITGNKGDTLNIPFATKYWYSGNIVNQVVIDTGIETSRDTNIVHHEFEEHYEVDSLYINIYHADICTLEVVEY